jgi:hypothetical protein
MNKGVRSGTGSAPKCHGSPKLAIRSDSDLYGSNFISRPKMRYRHRGTVPDSEHRLLKLLISSSRACFNCTTDTFLLVKLWQDNKKEIWSILHLWLPGWIIGNYGDCLVLVIPGIENHLQQKTFYVRYRHFTAVVSVSWWRTQYLTTNKSAFRTDKNSW